MTSQHKVKSKLKDVLSIPLDDYQHQQQQVEDIDDDDKDNENKENDMMNEGIIYPKPILFSSIWSVAMDESIEELVDSAVKIILKHKIWQEENTLLSIYGNGIEFSNIINTIYDDIDKSFWSDQWQDIYKRRIERRQISHYDQHMLDKNKRSLMQKCLSCCYPKDSINDDSDNEEKMDQEEEPLTQQNENDDDDDDPEENIEYDSLSLLKKWNLVSEQQRKFFWCFIVGMFIYKYFYIYL